MKASFVELGVRVVSRRTLVGFKAEKMMLAACTAVYKGKFKEMVFSYWLLVLMLF